MLLGTQEVHRVGALFDKVVTLLTAGGLAESYMAYTNTAISLMLDFKCVINPMGVMMELGERRADRTYTSGWEI